MNVDYLDAENAVDVLETKVSPESTMITPPSEDIQLIKTDLDILNILFYIIKI